MTRALLLMVHGSPRRESLVDVHQIADKLQARGDFDLVNTGFLECNEPSIGAAIDQCVQHGANEIIAVPYFLHSGNHVAEDIPAILVDAQKRYPNVQIFMSSYVGRSEAVTRLLQRRAAEAARDLS